jgi:hypothetical protein
VNKNNNLSSEFWSGCWEVKKGRVICRWMIVWTKIDEISVAGCIGGFSGGGAFQLEKFYKKKKSLIIEFEDKYSELAENIISIGEECQSRLLDFHSEKLWLDSENLHLKKSYVKKLRKQGDLLLGGVDLPDDFQELFERVGLISRSSEM